MVVTVVGGAPQYELQLDDPVDKRLHDAAEDADEEDEAECADDEEALSLDSCDVDGGMTISTDVVD